MFFLPLWRISVFPEPHYSKLYSFVNPPSVLGKSGELGEMRKGTALFLQGSCCSHTALNKFPGELGLGTVYTYRQHPCLQSPLPVAPVFLLPPSTPCLLGHNPFGPSCLLALYKPLCAF